MLTSTTSQEWFAIHTRSRFEKCVAKSLAGKGYETLLPVSRHARVWSGQRRELELPLFPGYVFSRFHREHRLPILQTAGVVAIVGGAAIAPVDQREIDAVMSIMRSGRQSSSTALTKGDRVRVVTGPLQGIEGAVVRGKGGTHLIVSVTLLQRGVLVEL